MLRKCRANVARSHRPCKTFFSPSKDPLIYGERDSHVVLLDCFFVLSLVFKAPESPQFPPERPLEAPQLGRKPELGKAH